MFGLQLLPRMAQDGRFMGQGMHCHPISLNSPAARWNPPARDFPVFLILVICPRGHVDQRGRLFRASLILCAGRVGDGEGAPDKGSTIAEMATERSMGKERA